VLDFNKLYTIIGLSLGL